MNDPAMQARSGDTLWVLVFSSAGHLLVHLCIAFYFVIVLALEADWGLPYHELIGLWTLGALMIGIAALPAGLVGDRLGAPATMVVFFLGMGACSVGAGTSETAIEMFLWLTGVGTFAAIYHPVCIPWLVRSARRGQGKALAFNGIFGSLGGAAAGISAGWLIDISGWRAAFMVPGTICLAVGVALLACILRGNISDAATRTGGTATGSDRRTLAVVFGLLTITMFLAGMIYYSTQTALPKLFELRHGGLVRDGTFGIGVMVACVYTVAAFMQLIGGQLADRYPLKTVYAGAILTQLPLLVLAAGSNGLTLVIIAILMVSANAAALPAENMLLARYTPANHHGLAFGAKFVLAFGAAPLAVQLVAFVQGATGEFYWLFLALSGFSLVALLAALLLPRSGNVAVQTI